MLKVATQTLTDYEMGKAATAAYRAIHSRIIDNTFKPGEALPERLLCHVIGVSRTPVREALRRLSSEGMINLAPHRTAYVPNIDRREIEETFSLAALLGNYSVRIAAQNISDAGLDDLLSLVDQMDDALMQENVQLFNVFVRLDHSFHKVIRKLVGNRRLIQIAGRLMSGPILLQSMARFTREHYKTSARLHRDIYEALKARDSDRAEAAMNEFVMASRDAALAIFQESKLTE